MRTNRSSPPLQQWWYGGERDRDMRGKIDKKITMQLSSTHVGYCSDKHHLIIHENIRFIHIQAIISDIHIRAASINHGRAGRT